MASSHYQVQRTGGYSTGERTGQAKATALPSGAAFPSRLAVFIQFLFVHDYFGITVVYIVECFGAWFCKGLIALRKGLHIYVDHAVLNQCGDAVIQCRSKAIVHLLTQTVNDLLNRAILLI